MLVGCQSTTLWWYWHTFHIWSKILRYKSPYGEVKSVHRLRFCKACHCIPHTALECCQFFWWGLWCVHICLLCYCCWLDHDHDCVLNWYDGSSRLLRHRLQGSLLHHRQESSHHCLQLKNEWREESLYSSAASSKVQWWNVDKVWLRYFQLEKLLKCIPATLNALSPFFIG